MARHLQAWELAVRLNAGKAIEQWLGARRVDGGRAIRWLRIHGTQLSVFDARDEGDGGFFDLYEFTVLRESHDAFGQSDDALAAAVRHGAHAERWVNEGVVQDEYADWIRAGRPD